MPDSLALPAIGLLAAALVALAMVWPQGLGARSPGPFGHPVAALVLPAPPTSAKPLTPATLRGREPAAIAHAAHPTT
jgi:hypothetical protein